MGVFSNSILLIILSAGTLITQLLKLLLSVALVVAALKDAVGVNQGRKPCFRTRRIMLPSASLKRQTCRQHGGEQKGLADSLKHEARAFQTKIKRVGYRTSVPTANLDTAGSYIIVNSPPSNTKTPEKTRQRRSGRGSRPLPFCAAGLTSHGGDGFLLLRAYS